MKREFRKAGVALVFVTGHQDPLYQAIDGAMAQNERKQICERIARGKAQTALRGKYIPGGHSPFGYQFRYSMIGKTERVVGLDEDPVTAPIAREMFSFVANGGTATGCASWLMERGIMTRKGGAGGTPPSPASCATPCTRASRRRCGSSRCTIPSPKRPGSSGARPIRSWPSPPRSPHRW